MKSRNLFVLSALAMLALTSCGVNPTTDEQPTTTLQPTLEPTTEESTSKVDTSDVTTTEESSLPTEETFTTEESTTEESSSKEESTTEESSSTVEVNKNDLDALSRRLGELDNLYTWSFILDGDVFIEGANAGNNYFALDEYYGLVANENGFLYEIKFDDKAQTWDFSHDAGFAETPDEAEYRKIENLIEEEFIYVEEDDAIVLADYEQMKVVEAAGMFDYFNADNWADYYLVDATVENKLTFTGMGYILDSDKEITGEEELFEVVFEANEFAGYNSIEEWLDTKPEQKGMQVSFKDTYSMFNYKEFAVNLNYDVFGGIRGQRIFSENSWIENYGDFGWGMEGMLNVTEKDRVINDGIYWWEHNNALKGLVYNEEEQDDTHALVNYINRSAGITYQKGFDLPTALGSALANEDNYNTWYIRNGAYYVADGLAYGGGTLTGAQVYAKCLLQGIQLNDGSSLYSYAEEVGFEPILNNDGEIEGIYTTIELVLGGFRYEVYASVFAFGNPACKTQIAEDFIANLPVKQEPTSEESSLPGSSEESSSGESSLPGSSEESSSGESSLPGSSEETTIVESSEESSIVESSEESSSAVETKVLFNLGDDSAESPKHGDGTSAEKYTETVGDYTLDITDGVKFYTGATDKTGNGCLKLGNASAAGSFIINVPAGVKEVNIAVAGYKANTAKISINGGDEVAVSTKSDEGEYTVITATPNTEGKVTFTTLSSGLRCMINYIEFVL